MGLRIVLLQQTPFGVHTACAAGLYILETMCKDDTIASREAKSISSDYGVISVMDSLSLKAGRLHRIAQIALRHKEE